MTAEPDKIDLKPCPFCGGKSGFGSAPRYHFVNCVDCLASTNQMLADIAPETPVEAAALWNTRPIEDALTARVKVLEHTLEQLHGPLSIAALTARAEAAEAEVVRLKAHNAEQAAAGTAMAHGGLASLAREDALEADLAAAIDARDYLRDALDQSMAKTAALRASLPGIRAAERERCANADIGMIYCPIGFSDGYRNGFVAGVKEVIFAKMKAIRALGDAS